MQSRETTSQRRRHARRKEAAQYLNEEHGLPETPQSLAKKAVYGGGPPFVKFGRWPLYPLDGLDAYALEAVSAPVRSTAELQKPQRRNSQGDVR